jgi:hypothetical protein
MTLTQLKLLAEAATPKWSHRERGIGIIREFEIVQAGGGILFRSTSYGSMEADAAHVGACCPDAILKIIADLEVAREALYLVLNQDRLKGYPTGKEWDELNYKIGAALSAMKVKP